MPAKGKNSFQNNVEIWESLEQPLAYDDTTTADYVYLGYAEIGTASSDAYWKIKKVSTAGDGTVTLYADGDKEYDNVWDNRDSLSYS